MKVGFHISVAGSVDLGVDRAASLNCNTFQIFTRNPRQWYSANLTKETAKTFSDKVKSYGIEPIFAHMPYLPNLASPRDEIYRKSVKVLTLELERCRQLEIPYLITHLGSHLGTGKDKGIQRVINALNQALEVETNVIVLLENTAGTKNSVGSYFEDLKQIISGIIFKERIGICFDTCHAFAAGYNLISKESITYTDQNGRARILAPNNRNEIILLAQKKGYINATEKVWVNINPNIKSSHHLLVMLNP